MERPRRLVVTFGALAVLIAVFVATSGPPAPAATPPGTFAFAALGDAPYYPWEELKYW